MKPKSLLLFWVLLGIAIIIMSVNNFQLRPVAPATLPDSARATALFVCPAADVQFDNAAANLGRFQRALSIIFMFIVLLWVAITGWVMYQALLKDKYDDKSFELPKFLGKFLLFSFIVATIVLKTPNHFRSVFVKGSVEKWVLCESNSPGAKAVKKDALAAAP